MIDLDRLIVTDVWPPDDFYFLPTCDAFPPRNFKPFPPQLRIYMRKFIQHNMIKKGLGNLSMRGHIVIHPKLLEKMYAAIDGDTGTEIT